MTARMTTDRPRPLPGKSAIEQACALLAQADALIITAGAGIGVDSGLPDFRGNTGFWKAYPALASLGIGFMDIASPAAFHADAHRAWGFYGHRLALYRETVPHAGFALLRAWGEQMEHGYFVFTSNVDGQFQRAGFDPDRIDECHGSIHHLQCLNRCCDAIWEADALVPEIDHALGRWQGPLPRCPHCGALARPNILMFDDWDWIGTRRDAQAKRRQQWLEKARRPVVIEVGAGLDIATVRHFSHRMVREHGASLIRINPRDSGIGNLAGVGLAGGSLAVLQAMQAIRAA